MNSIDKTTYSHYSIAYHIVWVTKYRKKSLKGEVAEYLSKELNNIAREKSWRILSHEVMPDHVHLFVSAPPAMAPSHVVKMFKGISARRLLMQYPKLNLKRRRCTLWSPSYYVGTAGHVSAETIKRYIKECQHA